MGGAWNNCSEEPCPYPGCHRGPPSATLTSNSGCIMSEREPIPSPEAFRDEVVKSYSGKVAKKRAKHILVNDPEVPAEIEANVRTIPGIISQRGCCYAGCKGVVM